MVGCEKLKKMELVFNGMIDEPFISFCCRDNIIKPQMALLNDAESTIIDLKKFIREYTERGFESHECMNCAQKKYIESTQDRIEFVNLSMYPSSCQCNCTYCDIVSNKKFMMFDKEKHYKKYIMLFDILKELISEGLIDKDALWQVSPGEISVHPLKNEILDMVYEKKCIIYSNCFIYDDRIADILRCNKNSFLNFSIDAGCYEAWKKIKGHNNFYQVLDVLKRYVDVSNGYKINIKYILMPDHNDGNNDLDGLIKILSTLKIDKIILSHDYDEVITKKDISIMRKFKDKLERNGIYVDTTAFDY